MRRRARAGVVLDGQRGDGEQGGRSQGLEPDPPGLPSHLAPLLRVRDRLGSRIQVALTARGEAHSGLGAGLEHSQAREPQQREQ